ncbi:hypothetical protein [Mesorhizobium temperatum]|uniref:Uncharacterized protein n=1 Tax=Mesorhizobium temperatum TaxID=241416 RepID=A0A271LK28_9HYPH|nr:hypothetical protein [Mesorhizobium temperatum]PAQ08491.1 hypothetical protein CIT26_16290 [Mesorhizobium temperatum]
MMYPLSIAFGLAAGLANFDQRGSDGIRATGELFVRIALAGPVPEGLLCAARQRRDVTRAS